MSEGALTRRGRSEVAVILRCEHLQASMMTVKNAAFAKHHPSRLAATRLAPLDEANDDAWHFLILSVAPAQAGTQNP